MTERDRTVAIETHSRRRLSRGTTRLELTLDAWWRGLRDDHTWRGRFSITKASKFLHYAQSTSTVRQILVILLFPLPGLIAALALPLIPLQNPLLGPRHNWGINLHNFGVNWIAMTSGLIQTRAVAGVPHHEYSTCSIVLVATLAALGADGFFMALGFLWRFPIPLFPTFAPFPFVVCLIIAHAIIFQGGRLRHEVRTKLVLYVPSLSIQVSQLIVYPAYSALLTAANDWQQVILVLLFPFIKYCLRRLIFKVSRHLRDFAQEIAFCGVEICASMYQSTIMQTTPSALVTVLIIGIDVLFNIFHIQQHFSRPSVLSTTEIFSTATEILQRLHIPIHDIDLIPYASKTKHPLTSIVWIAPRAVVPVDSLGRAQPEDAIVPKVPSDTDKIILTHALEILQAAESIMLVEYLEVAVPVVNALYLIVGSQLPSATYNSKLRSFHDDSTQLGPAVTNILLYTALQGLTLLGMGLVLRVRYQFSARTLLAFVLEAHAWSLHGKLAMWLVAILAIPVVHYGVDFTFKFDYSAYQ